METLYFKNPIPPYQVGWSMGSLNWQGIPLKENGTLLFNIWYFVNLLCFQKAVFYSRFVKSQWLFWVSFFFFKQLYSVLTIYLLITSYLRDIITRMSAVWIQAIQKSARQRSQSDYHNVTQKKSKIKNLKPYSLFHP